MKIRNAVSAARVIKSKTKHYTSALNLKQIEYVFALCALLVYTVRKTENSIKEFNILSFFIDTILYVKYRI